jgi:hypothetical protein
MHRYGERKPRGLFKVPLLEFSKLTEEQYEEPNHTAVTYSNRNSKRIVVYIPCFICNDKSMELSCPCVSYYWCVCPPNNYESMGIFIKIWGLVNFCRGSHTGVIYYRTLIFRSLLDLQKYLTFVAIVFITYIFHEILILLSLIAVRTNNEQWHPSMSNLA